MTKSDKLKKIIEYAVERGWERPWRKSHEGYSFWNRMQYFNQHADILFSHDFAKDVFGEEVIEPEIKFAENPHFEGGGYNYIIHPAIVSWKHHLQQIVLLEPEKIIDYYYKYVKSQN